MFVYSCSIKIHVSGVGYLLESIFCILLVVKAFSLQKDIEMFKEVMVGERSGEYGRWGRALQPNVFNFWNVGCATCSWVLLQSRIGLFLFTNAGCRCFSFECIPLICWPYFSNVMVSLGFRKLWWIRPAADQWTVTMTIFGASLILGSALELLLGLAPELVIAGCCIQSALSHITSSWEMVCCCRIQQEKTTLQNEDAFDLSQLMRNPLTELLYLSSLLQMSNNCRMADTEFLGNFSCSWKRIRFNDPLSWSLSTSSGWPLWSSSSRLSSPLQNFLNHHCTVHSSSTWLNKLVMLQVVSTALWHILNLNRKFTQICFLSNINSVLWNICKNM